MRLSLLSPYIYIATEEDEPGWKPLVAMRYPLRGFVAHSVPLFPAAPDVACLTIDCDESTAAMIATDPDVFVLEGMNG